MQTATHGCLTKILLTLAVWAGCLPAECAMTVEEIARKKAEDDRKEWRRPHLEKRLLETKECEGCEMRYLEFAGVDLRGARLRDAFLSGDLRNLDLRDADLEDAALSGDLRGADLRGSNVQRIMLRGNLAGTRLDGLDLRTVHAPDTIDWSYAILRGANLENLSFYGDGPANHRPSRFLFDDCAGGAVMRGVDLRGANLRGTFLVDCDLRDADLRQADLTGAVLPPRPRDRENANFSGAMGPWGLRCAEGTSIGNCIPVGTAKEFREMRRKILRYCSDGWAACAPP